MHKAAQRERERAASARVFTIRLSANEAELLLTARQRQRGSIEGFEARALVTGALFLANAGNVRGAKLKRQGGDSGPPAAKC